MAMTVVMTQFSLPSRGGQSHMVYAAHAVVPSPEAGEG